jgi:Tol biopolymer transport system component
MGDVYRARDLDLDRDVAIKVLPPEVVNNEDRVRRFVQEAKAASSLNHPHIVTVYEIGKAEQPDGSAVQYIAMELIEGETLRAKIQSGRNLKQMLGYAAQAADALAKAHAAGIVHRDLKPDNVMVTRDGFAKVLDFGLAKLTAVEQREVAEAATEVRPQTREGLVMGTVGYMSPEQAEGRTVDHRSDIFSFGCILYEIATGKRPFTGKSDIDVLHAIVHYDPPPITDANPGAPAELRRIVRRCLAKDADQRIQSMRDLANTLRDLIDEFDQLTPGSGSSAAVAARPPEKHRAPWTVAAIAVLAAALLGIWALWKRPASPPATTTVATKPQMSLEAITSTGKAAHGALSPDGRYVAYNALDGPKSSLRVRQLATGSEVELFPLSADVAYWQPQYSPDGNYLYVRRSVKDSSVGTLVTVPALGGQPREILQDIAGKVAFSPDGRQIAFVRTTRDASSAHVADADGSNIRLLVTRPPDQAFTPALSWSPDGKWIAAAHRNPTGGLHSVMLMISPDGQTVRPFGRDRWFYVGELTWLPGMRGLAVSGQTVETGRPQLWIVSYPEGTAQRLSSDLNAYVSLSVSADGKSLIATQGDRRGGVTRVDVSDRSMRNITAGRMRHLPHTLFQVDSAGRIIYFSAEAGTMDIWALEPDGVTKTQLTSLPGAEFAAALAPRDTIYYQHEREDRLELHAMTTNGAGRRVVATLPPMDGTTRLMPDGKAVLIASNMKKVLVPLDGTPQRQLDLPPGGAALAFSPDGKQLAGFFNLSLEEGRRAQLAIFGVDGGRPIRVFERGETQLPHFALWTRDGRFLVYLDTAGGPDNLWLQPVEGGAPRQLTTFTDVDHEIVGVAAGPDNSIYVSRVLGTYDLVKISDFQ